jgi:hypothetical protein
MSDPGASNVVIFDVCAAEEEQRPAAKIHIKSPSSAIMNFERYSAEALHRSWLFRNCTRSEPLRCFVRLVNGNCAVTRQRELAAPQIFIGGLLQMCGFHEQKRKSSCRLTY